MARQLIASKHLSQDKLCLIDTVLEHFPSIRNESNTESKKQLGPNLLVTGAPGTGKSWLIDLITELAELMELEKPIKTAFMGIAAININGYTMNSFLDIPVEMNEGSGTSKHIKPWNQDKLEQFKQMYDMQNLSVLIVDEVSMIKPWMLAYLDERMKEATQNFDKPFGGVALIMFGDFDQQPPIGGSSLPHYAMKLLEQEYQQRNNLFFVKLNRQEQFEINSNLCKNGVRLFQSAAHLKLTQQHRCASDSEHMANLNKMNSSRK